MSNFQMTLLGVFAFFILVAVLIFAGIVPGLKGTSGVSAGGTVVFWGTIPASTMSGLVEDFNRTNKPLEVVYVEKSPVNFDSDLTEALASGVGPDLIMLPEYLIYRHADKVYPIPYPILSERDFKNTFVQEGELYLASQGILSLPFRIDPMVMYWNRGIISSSGISLPPASWEELLSMAPRLVSKDSSGNIVRSAVSFGEFKNVNYAKDILALLNMQAGNGIIERTAGGYTSVFGDSSGPSLKPANEAVRYYSGFSNPVQPQYSWNKSLPSSRDAFLSGTLAIYFGYASELFGIRNLNPHLDFDVARVPQVKGASSFSTIGHIDGISVLKGSKSIPLALEAAMLLSGADFEVKLTQQTFLPPPRRDLLSQKPTDAYMSLFFESALISKGWIDPSPYNTSAIFSELVENVVSGRLQVGEAVMNANSQLSRLIGITN